MPCRTQRISARIRRHARKVKHRGRTPLFLEAKRLGISPDKLIAKRAKENRRARDGAIRKREEFSRSRNWWEY